MVAFLVLLFQSTSRFTYKITSGDVFIYSSTDSGTAHLFHQDGQHSVLVWSMILSISLFSLKTFLRAVLVSQRNWEEGTEISYITSVLVHAQLPVLSACPTRMVVCYNMHLH